MNQKNADRVVSMKDVAGACGVSVVTVSRALRGDRNHASETRERILRAAEELGYRVNPLVSALMSARGRHKPAKGTVNLAILNPGEEDWRTHPFYLGVVAQAKALGFSIELFGFKAGQGAVRTRKVMQARGVRGIIVMPSPRAEWCLEFDLSGFAAATIGYSIVAPNMPRVVTDTYGRMMTALGEVAVRGYRRIGVLGTDDLDRRFQYLGTAAVEVFKKTARGHASVFCMNLPQDMADEEKCAQVVEWIRAKRLDAVVSQLGLHEGLRAAGQRLPGKTGYIFLHHCDDPMITSMDQNQEWIGRKATDVVVGMINRNEFQVPEQSQTIMIPSVWREGMTLPVRRGTHVVA